MNPSVQAFHPNTGAAMACAEDPRQARIDARRAFVATKLVFMDACTDLTGSNAALLTRQVRDTATPSDLWALLPAMLAALPAGAACTMAHAEALARQLESLAPDSELDTGHVPL